MRLPFVLILAAAIACVRAHGASDETSATPAVLQPLPALNVGTGSGAASLNLGAFFGIPGATGQVVQLNTTLGKINIELRDDKAPATVANFLSYVTSGAYDHLLIQRLVADFIFQTGGHTLGGSTVYDVQSLGTVVNEFNLSNTRGTLAMAKVGPAEGQDPTPETINSATNQWFINLVDNSANLDNQNGGFTVFAQVLGTGMSVADAIAAIPTYDASGLFGGDFTDMPLYNYTGGSLQISNLVVIDSLPLLPLLSVESTNPAIITASITGATLATSQLVLVPQAAGAAGITVRAADTSGHVVESTFIASSTGVTVGAGQAAAFRVANTAAATFQWQRFPAGGAGWADIHDGDGYTGTTTASLMVPANLVAAGDQYHCIVTAVGAGTTTTAQRITVLGAAPSVVHQGSPLAIAGGGASAGTKYFAKGLPKGLKINASTGQITGTVASGPGVYSYTAWSQVGKTKSAVTTRMLVVQPFLPAMTGAFEGLLFSTGGVPSGKIAILVAANGAYTGTMTYGNGFVAKLKGVLALNALNSSASASIPLKGGATLAIAVDRDGVFTGSLTLPGTPPSVDTMVGGAKVGGYGASSPAPWQGSYAMTLGDVYNYGTLPAPSGAGHMVVTIAPTGVMSLRGKFSDGTVVTGSYATDADGTYRPMIMPYKRAWSYAAGFLPLSPRDGQPSTYHVASGRGQDFYWSKNASTKDKVFPAGFGWLGLNLVVEPWTPVADVGALATKLGLGSGRTLTLLVSRADAGAIQGLSNQSPNNTYSLPVTVTLPASGTTATLTGSGTSSLTATVNLADGSFTGTMNLAAVGSMPARVVPLEGTFLQLVAPAAGDTVGQGFFLLPGATKTAPKLGGLIKLSVPASTP
ncbi:MAG: peptidylprolyl isomerase [Opitutaceae bacterium]|jgi:cyclophilin family peptidyl-prolyl cis-trans isomerase